MLVFINYYVSFKLKSFRMNYKFSTLFVFLFFFLNSYIYLGQSNVTKYCDANQGMYDRMAIDPAFKAQVDSVKQLQQEHLTEYLQNNSASRSGTVYYIPIVYHILHTGGEENISNEQILSDLEQLNNMFNKLNPSWTNVNSSFTPADVEIEFLLAQKKDDGSCFSGITRTYSSLTSHNSNSSGVANAVKAVHGNFPGNKYLNIFVCKSIGGAAGYTTQPWATGMQNGIFILHNYVGTTGTSNFTTENGTTSHEAGHWLNLDHPWGPSNSPNQASNCSIDDGIGDTPNTIGWISCNPNGSSCGSLDNVENIMDYSYCPSHMFSLGQRNAMRSAATSFVGGRSTVTSSSNHSATGIFADILCNTDFSVNKKVVCENDVVQFTDESYHNATSWSWSFPGGTPSSSNAQNPSVTYPNSGTYNVTLTATNSSGNQTITKQAVKVLGYWGHVLPYAEGFDVSPTLPNDFSIDGGAINNWEATNAANFSGTNSVYINNFSNLQGAIGELESHTINLGGQSSANISFQYAYAKKTSTLGESVQFLVSSDCGNTWVVLRGLTTTASSTNSSFVPSGTGDWGYLNISIPSSFLTPNFRFKFRVENNGGNNIYVDDINITGVASINEIDNLSEIKVFPNPFRSNTNLNFKLNKRSEISISLLDLTGKEIQLILPKQELSEGDFYQYIINGDKLKSGTYFIRFIVNGQEQSQRVIIY